MHAYNASRSAEPTYDHLDRGSPPTTSLSHSGRAAATLTPRAAFDGTGARSYTYAGTVPVVSTDNTTARVGTVEGVATLVPARGLTEDPSSPLLAVVAAKTGATAAERALASLPKAARNSEKPPGFNPETWQWREGSRANVPRSWWDPEGGEWRFHPADKYHDPHFDYNPWQQWNNPWQHLYPGD